MIDRIWRSRGSLCIEEQVSADEVLERLSCLFDAEEMTLDRMQARIDYRKFNPAAQDRLATFSNGTLRLTEEHGRKVVHFDVGSPALLLTFLAPVLFLALGGGIVGLGQWEEAKVVQQGEQEEEKEEEEEPAELHWIDQMLGAPAPEKPDKDKDEKEEEEEEENEDYSPNQAFGVAALFALLYLVGRILEPKLFKKTLRGALGPSIAQ